MACVANQTQPKSKTSSRGLMGVIRVCLVKVWSDMVKFEKSSSHWSFNGGLAIPESKALFGGVLGYVCLCARDIKSEKHIMEGGDYFFSLGSLFFSPLSFSFIFVFFFCAYVYVVS